MTRLALVEEVCGEEVVISFLAASCDGCTTPCGACHTSAKKKETARLKNTLSAKVGDKVEVLIPSDKVVWFSLFLFLFPIVLSALLSWLFVPMMGEAKGVLLSVGISLVLVFSLAFVFSSRRKGQGDGVVLLAISPCGENEKELDKREKGVYNDMHA